jgi:uncharacterized integral membrane protein (TIGR00698 family)
LDTDNFYIWGILLTLLISLVAQLLGGWVPTIGSSIFALALGMVFSPLVQNVPHFTRGLNLVSQKVLRWAIILLGTGISITQVLSVGKYSLVVMIFTLSAAFGSAYLCGKILRVNWQLSSLIAAGTGICGGSAIATISPVIDATETDIAYAMSATFIFDVLMIILFPLMGRMLNLSDLAYGLWTGTAVNDTASVVAAGYAYSRAAGNFATVVKLTRTTSIVPIALVFAVVSSRRNRDTSAALPGDLNIFAMFPWFILLFVGSAGLNSLGLIPPHIQGFLASGSKFMMAMALGAIGLKTDTGKMLQAGPQPMLLGFIVSAVVVVVAISVQFFLGQI